jgi:hypothetical protein
MKYNKARPPIVQPIEQPYRYVPLTRGQVAIVDLDDFTWVSQWNWSALWIPSKHGFYAVRSAVIEGKKRCLYLHRELLQCSPDEYTDHRDGNSLDCRRSNIRRCRPIDNTRNRGVQTVNTSGLKGVSFDRFRNKWKSRINVDGKEIFLGRFANSMDAAIAYNNAAREYYGDFAWLNQVQNGS